MLDCSFEKAMQKVEGAIKHLTDLTTLSGSFETRAELQQRHVELVNLLHRNDEQVEFPLKIVPRPAYQGFHGRLDVLSHIRQHLDINSAPDKLRSILVYGLGGVGKTQTALHYAHDLNSQYDAIFWARSETEAALNASFAEFATGLKLPGARLEGDAGQNLLLFQSWLRTQAARTNGNHFYYYLIKQNNC